MTQFTSTTRRLLEQAGWTEHRTFDTTSYRDSLRARGYVVHPAALAFLGRYGGLVVTPPHARAPGKTDEFHFDAVRAAKVTHAEVLTAFSRMTPAPLCVVGQASRGYAEVAVDGAGGVYTMRDGLLFRAGASDVEGIEALCAGREGELVGELPDDD